MVASHNWNLGKKDFYLKYTDHEFRNWLLLNCHAELVSGSLVDAETSSA